MCHPERSKGSRFLAQGKLREESHRVNKLKNRDSSLPAGGQGLTPQNDITTQSPGGEGKGGVFNLNDLFSLQYRSDLPSHHFCSLLFFAESHPKAVSKGTPPTNGIFPKPILQKADLGSCGIGRRGILFHPSFEEDEKGVSPSQNRFNHDDLYGE